MTNASKHTALSTARDVASFFVPKKTVKKSFSSKNATKRVVALIPTYRPHKTTYRLVEDLIKSYSNIEIVVVDDCTPLTAVSSITVLENITKLQKTNKNISVLRTPVNLFKASALNFGLDYIFSQKNPADVIVTLDDDVEILPDTLTYMVEALFAEKNIGVVCSTAWVKNKKKNILTRLQALEYHGFSITKLSDNGFLLGPLVMQGMLSAFRLEAIKRVKGFDAEKLIEDYDITVRIKNAGWKTAIAPKAIAYTHVPESLGALWKQRVRWSYGGLIVIKDSWRNLASIFQDVIGHTLFLSIFSLVILSLIFTKHNATPPLLIVGLVSVALFQFILAFTFSLISLITYHDRDRKDWLLKLSIFPEFAYSNVLSAILIGSYLFFAFNILSYYASSRLPALKKIQDSGTKSFRKLGYTASWGTRIDMKEVIS